MNTPAPLESAPAEFHSPSSTGHTMLLHRLRTLGLAAVLPLTLACHPTSPTSPTPTAASDAPSLAPGHAPGATPETPTALPEDPPPAPTRVVMGDRHTCALDRQRLWCWGGNASGQLGDGTRVGRHRPAEVLAAPVTAVSAGSGHTCAVQAGALHCWGANDVGQLGDGTFTERAIPALVPGLERDVSQVVSHGTESCALRAGRPWCWGEARDTPAMIEGVEAADALTVGDRVACARTADGARCWRLTSTASVPLEGLPADAHGLYIVPSDPFVFAIEEGFDQAFEETLCGLDKAGGLWCGALAEQAGEDARLDGMSVHPEWHVADGVTAVAQHHVVFCYRRYGEVLCGYDGSFSPATVKPEVEAPGSLAMGRSGSRCIAGDGAVTCWGANPFGETGAVPRDAAHAHVPPGLESGVRRLSGGGPDGFCAIRGRAVVCLRHGELVTVAEALGRARDVSGSGAGGCAVLDGGLYCWGQNESGQRGFGHRLWTSQEKPTAIPGLEQGVTAVAHGGATVCAVQDGGVKCWGANAQGRPVPGCASDPCLTPTPVPGLEAGVSQIAGSASRMCAVQAAGAHRRLVCWGTPGAGLAAGDDAPTVLVDRLDTPLAVGLVMNAARTCASSRAGLRCWGDEEGDPLRSPLEVGVGADDSVGVAALGPASGCLQSNGEVRCWADADDPPGWRSLRPVPALRGALDAVGGEGYVCAAVRGQVRCLGDTDRFLSDADAQRPTHLVLPRRGVSGAVSRWTGGDRDQP